MLQSINPVPHHQLLLLLLLLLLSPHPLQAVSAAA
jgi:hypothetical protein